MSTSDSRESAAEAVIRKFEEHSDELENRIAQSILNRDFVQQILDFAWKYQFRENRSDFRSSVKSLVGDAIERQKMEAEG